MFLEDGNTVFGVIFLEAPEPESKSGSTEGN